MKNFPITFVILILILASCSTNKRLLEPNKTRYDKIEFNIEKDLNNDISEIIEVIIYKEHLNVSKDNLNTTKLCSELKKITIDVPIEDNQGVIPPAAPGNRYITTILYDHISDEILFSKKDSSFILSQNSNPKRIKIERKITERLNTTTFQKELKKIKNGEDYDFYEMSIPIFSLDKQTAYIELDYRCGHLCGNGRAFYLRKINGKWKIIEDFRTWIS
ncbi:hypothetical protein SAMN04487764_1837 [Gillisia sp. Hel1_33_143]|uniref:hypothetical protein n=1 Tax=Gillisia sp. Hel1_33_143 TaxID=1336796 RepID=UPI00087A881D|nr:hypothetical protein [Gillisia sp. Hel1_33_143]SDS27291.1 hypothetical protein SAMN04487764_1837 [Gillisia sp. Hel1_33_143]